MGTLRILSILLASTCLAGASALLPTGAIGNGHRPSVHDRWRSPWPSRVRGVGVSDGGSALSSSLTSRRADADRIDGRGGQSLEPSPLNESSCDGRTATRRRRFLALLATATAPAWTTTAPSATAIDNPLNLKGTFWETGQLYEKSNAPLPDDEEGFFAILDQTVEALHSPTLTDAIAEGRYGQASRLLRGGLVSESQIRLAANALIERLPEEDDEMIYKSNESFRLFVRYLDVLDAEVEAAARPSLGSGEGDPRMKILTRLGEAEDAMTSFVRNVRGGLGVQEGK